MNTVSTALNGRTDLSIHTVPIDTGAVWVEITRMSHSTCDRCGQPIPVEHPGPVVWVDPRTGDEQGNYSHQHRCGEWNTPMHAGALMTDDPDIVSALRRDVDQQVDADVARRTRDIREALKGELRAVLTEVARPLEDDEAIEDRIQGVTVDESTPGVVHDFDGFAARADDPLGREGETIVVTEEDL